MLAKRARVAAGGAVAKRAAGDTVPQKPSPGPRVGTLVARGQSDGAGRAMRDRLLDAFDR